jgi:4-oxalocrotonate tautomerase
LHRFVYGVTKGKIMPYINIKITDEGVTNEQRKRLIAGATQLMVDVLHKDPKLTFVLIDEINTDNWGVAGESTTVLRRRQQQQEG